MHVIFFLHAYSLYTYISLLFSILSVFFFIHPSNLQSTFFLFVGAVVFLYASSSFSFSIQEFATMTGCFLLVNVLLEGKKTFKQGREDEEEEEEEEKK